MTDLNRPVASVEEASAVVCPYDAAWPFHFHTEAIVVKKALGRRVHGIEHFGSTSVPNLAAKPVIDILVGTDGTTPTNAAVDALAKHGYEFLGQDGRRPDRWFWRKRSSESFNLSLVPHGGDLWKANLWVRDYLRVHPTEADAYAAAKYEAAQHSPTSLIGYQNYKREFVEGLVARAARWAFSNNS